MELEWKVPQWSNAIERDRARTYHQAYSALVGLYNLEKALVEVRAGRTKSWTNFKVPRGGGQRRLPRGRTRRHLAPHGDQGRQDRELPAVPADAVEREPARQLRHARALRGRGAEHADLRGERARQLQGHRHHARGAQLRPVPAVRRAHVPRQGPRKKVVHTPDGALLMAAAARAARSARSLPGARGAPRVDRRRRRARVAEGMIGAMLELYGEGLERIFAALEQAPRGACDALADDGVVASLLLIHGLYPVPLADARGGGARQRAAVHGVARRRRRARRAWRRTSRTCGCSAAATAAPRRRRRSSSRSARRSTRPRPISRARGRGPRRARRPSAKLLPLVGQDADGAAALGRRLGRRRPRHRARWRRHAVGGVPLLIAERRRHAARVPQRLRRLRRAAAPRRARRAACSRARLLGAVRAAARGPRARRGRCSSRPCRCCEEDGARPGRASGDRGRAAIRRAAPPAARRALALRRRPAAAAVERCDLCGGADPRRPPPPAAPRGAA